MGRDYAIAALLAAVLLTCGAGQVVPHVVGPGHDDAVYVATAKALAEGDGYRLIDLPGSPRQTSIRPSIRSPLRRSGRCGPAFRRMWRR